jgi:hypothetical protein
MILFAFGRLQSSLPKALKPFFAPHPLDFIEIGYLKASSALQSSLPKALKPLFAPHPLDFIEIGYLKASSDTFADY